MPPNPAKTDDDNALRGRRRAAAFILSLDSETAALVMSRMNEREVTMISEEMTRLGEISGADMETLLKDFNKAIGGDRVSVEPMIQAILERALGKEKAKELLEKIRKSGRDSEPFKSLMPLDARQVSTLLRGEHPQVISLVVAHLEPAIAADVMRDMPDELRYEVIKRIASTGELPIELVRQIDEMMEVRAFALGKSRVDDQGNRRYKTVAQMLNIADPSVSKAILERLNKEAPQLATDIQQLMFVFEDLIKIPDKDFQKVLGEIEKNDLLLSLRAAPPEVTEKIYNNLSARAREGMQEEMEMMGAKPLGEIEEAQKRILQHVRGMEERGEIRVQRGNAVQML
ncbi:MAG: hypothetical protein RLZZ127_2253 [Planctomycetota bacterium]|jgi:flagellar motor switch protein FliG